MNTEIKEILLGEICEFYDYAVEIRRHVHKYPELSTKEVKTIEYIAGILEQNGISHTVLPDGAGIVAVVGNNGRCYGFRAELDALPVTEKTGLEFSSVNEGVMHACGHDIHLATVVGMMLHLKKHEDELPFTVKALLQPAEESVGGADKMIKLGCMENPHVDEVYGIHVDPTIPTGSITLMPGVMNAAVMDFDIKILGQSCHSAHPDQGVDAIVIAGSLISSLQSIPSRNFAPTTPVILTIGKINGGTKSNIVCGEVNMTGTLRALSSDVINELGARVKKLSESVAESFGGSAVVTLHKGYPELYNDKEKTNALIEKCEKILGKENVIIMNDASLGADDFAYFSKAAPGCYFNIGCRKEDQGDDQVLHGEYFSPDEECMKIAYKAFLSIMTE